MLARPCLVFLSACVPSLLCAGYAIAAEPAYDDGLIDTILRTYVDDNGLVNYRDLKDSRGPLDTYIASLGAVDPEAFRALPEPERKAFLINAYNAITLQRILDHYPIQRGGVVTGLRFPENSIRQIEGVWDRLTTPVLRAAMTLDHIEHEILRKEFHDPRLHAALVCAAIGCPPLRAEAYTAAGLDEQLDDQSRRFLGATHRFRIDRENNIVFLSPVLKWYGADFVSAYNRSGAITGNPPEISAVLDYASGYVGSDNAKYIRTGKYRVEFLDYDWSLNEQK
jgi:hypothetical protein